MKDLKYIAAIIFALVIGVLVYCYWPSPKIVVVKEGEKRDTVWIATLTKVIIDTLWVVRTSAVDTSYIDTTKNFMYMTGSGYSYRSENGDTLYQHNTKTTIIHRPELKGNNSLSAIIKRNY